MNSEKNKARAIVVIFFVLGVIMGIGVMNFIAAKSSVPKKMTWLETIDAEVSLTPEQKSVVGALIDTHNERSKEISNQIKPQLDDLRVNTRAKIRASLSPDQQLKYDALLKRKDAEKAAAEAAAQQQIKAK